VTRERDPRDRPRNAIGRTATGKRRLRRMDRDVQRGQGGLLEPLDATERETLTVLLRRWSTTTTRTIDRAGRRSGRRSSRFRRSLLGVGGWARSGVPISQVVAGGVFDAAQPPPVSPSDCG